MSDPGYAVIAVETTGPSFRRNDRVVEVAIVHLDRGGRVTGEWDTMVNPERSPGAGHGLFDEELAPAPNFARIAPTIVDRVAGRVIVAHNPGFETGFLLAELARTGYRAPRSIVTLGTMQLAREFLPGAGRSLDETSAAAGLSVVNARGASAAAGSTARLLASFIATAPTWHGWSEALAAAQVDWPHYGGEHVPWLPRGTRAPSARSYLQRIATGLPAHPGPMEELEYLSMLDRVVADHDVSTPEADALVDLAASYGIDAARAARLHDLFFDQLTTAAWRDGLLSISEMSAIVAIGALLDVHSDVVQRAMGGPAS